MAWELANKLADDPSVNLVSLIKDIDKAAMGRNKAFMDNFKGQVMVDPNLTFAKQLHQRAPEKAVPPGLCQMLCGPSMIGCCSITNWCRVCGNIKRALAAVKKAGVQNAEWSHIEEELAPADAQKAAHRGGVVVMDRAGKVTYAHNDYLFQDFYDNRLFDTLRRSNSQPGLPGPGRVYMQQ